MVNRNTDFMKQMTLPATILIWFLITTSLIAQPTDQYDLAGKMHHYLTQLEEDGFQGSVLAARDGQIIHMSGYGMSDRSNLHQNSSSTIFDIGSITKQFTAAAILKLEMQGKLNVNDLMSKYFEHVPEDKSAITIHHLLTHSAGLPAAIGDDYEAITEAAFVEKVMTSKLHFKAGSGYRYSNVGYSLLTLIIEKVSGQNYETYLNEQLFQPSKMTSTGYQIPKWHTDQIAIGYRGKQEWGRPIDQRWAKDGPFLHLKGNGGILSSVEDMYKWHLALLGDQILNQSAKNKMHTKHVEEGEGAGSYYGYGWAIFPTPRNTELIAHNGGNGIFFADFWRYLDEKMTVIMMTNCANRKFERIPSELAKMMREN